jgi:hypothetical protein
MRGSVHGQGTSAQGFAVGGPAPFESGGADFSFESVSPFRFVVVWALELTACDTGVFGSAISVPGRQMKKIEARTAIANTAAMTTVPLPNVFAVDLSMASAPGDWK